MRAWTQLQQEMPLSRLAYESMDSAAARNASHSQQASI
jgi:hypothetical protein